MTVDLLNFGLKAAGALVGGSEANKQKDYNRQLDHQNYKHARDQFEQGIQYRVKDAKKAGLHPLFALGYQGSGGGGIHAGAGGQPQGSAVGAALSNFEIPRGLTKPTVLQDELVRSQIEAQKASARRDVASAQYSDSQTALATQEALTKRPGDGAVTYPLMPDLPIPKRALEMGPFKNNPMWRRVHGDKNRAYDLPDSDIGFEDIFSIAPAAAALQYFTRGYFNDDAQAFWAKGKPFRDKNRKALEDWVRKINPYR